MSRSYKRSRSYGTNLSSQALGDARYGVRNARLTKQVPGYVRGTSAMVYGRGISRRFRSGGIKNAVRRYAEQKYTDGCIGQQSDPVGVSITSGGYFSNMTVTISQGNGDSHNRIGDKICVNSIEIRGRIDNIISNTLLAYDVGTVRMVVFKWYTDSTPTLFDLFDTQAYNGAVNAQYAPHYPYNHDKKSYRKILYDELYTCTQSAFYTGQEVTFMANDNSRQCFNIFIDLKKYSERVRMVHYQAGTTTAIGAFYAFFISEVPSRGCQALMWFRMNYTDV